jgi:hypothetical protein
MVGAGFCELVQHLLVVEAVCRQLMLLFLQEIPQRPKLIRCCPE